MSALHCAAYSFLRKQHTRLVRLRLIFHIYDKAVHIVLLECFWGILFPLLFYAKDAVVLIVDISADQQLRIPSLLLDTTNNL